MELRTITVYSDWEKIRQLYKTAFPRYERKPFIMIRRKYEQKQSDIWVFEENGEFLGFAVTMNAKDMVLLDYFAMDGSKRGAGYGTLALKLLQDYYKDRRFFLEIESVYEAADNLPQRQRRKAFYLKNGMSEVGVMAQLFGVNMELLGYGCEISFPEYLQVYLTLYGDRVRCNVKEIRR